MAKRPLDENLVETSFYKEFDDSLTVGVSFRDNNLNRGFSHIVTENFFAGVGFVLEPEDLRYVYTDFDSRLSDLEDRNTLQGEEWKKAQPFMPYDPTSAKRPLVDQLYSLSYRLGKKVELAIEETRKDGVKGYYLSGITVDYRRESEADRILLEEQLGKLPNPLIAPRKQGITNKAPIINLSGDRGKTCSGMVEVDRLLSKIERKLRA